MAQIAEVGRLGMKLEADFGAQGPGPGLGIAALGLGTVVVGVGNVALGVGTAPLEVGTAPLEEVGNVVPVSGVGSLAPGLAVAEAQLWPQVVGNSAPAAEVGNFVGDEDFEHADQN